MTRSVGNPGERWQARDILVRLAVLLIAQMPLLRASPLKQLLSGDGSYGSMGVEGGHEPEEAAGPTLWVYLIVAVLLVLLGGAFAGLTIALMGQVGRWISRSRGIIGRDLWDRSYHSPT